MTLKVVRPRRAAVTKITAVLHLYAALQLITRDLGVACYWVKRYVKILLAFVLGVNHFSTKTRASLAFITYAPSLV